ncbi:MAG: C40 family peptidase [Acidimicrobiales bacterium]
MIRVRRRGTTRSTPLIAIAAALLSGLVVPVGAQAQTIAQTQAEIAQLSATLSQQEKTSEITANAYDAAKVNLANLNVDLIKLQAKEVVKRAAMKVTSAQLATAVVRAYVDGASEAQILSLFNQKVTTYDARSVYQRQVIGDLNSLENSLRKEKRSLDTTLADVATQRAKVQHETVNMQNLLAQNVRNEEITRTTLAVVTSKLKSEIITYEIAAGAAAARAHDLAAEASAVNAASAVGGQPAANLVIAAIQAATPPVITGTAAGSAQGLAALKWAKSQIGVPYVWGGETPGVGFDCSGLTQWAWAKAGFTIPRTTETQWADLRHISLKQLQPGDLLYYYNLDGDHQVDHVVMYAGSGPWGTSTIIAAAHSGTNVSLAPIFTFGLIGAARP